MSDQTAPAPPPAPPPPAAQAPAPPPAPEPPAAQAEPEAAAGNSKDRPYGIFTQRTLKVGTAPERKAALEDLAKIAPEGGEVMILVQLGTASAKSPKAAVEALADKQDVDDDLEAIADSSRVQFPGVKVQSKRTVTFGN